MKKILPLYLLIFLTACGTNTPSSSTLLGESRVFSPVALSSGERERLTALCNALTSKAQALTQTNTQSLSFSVSERACSTESGFVAGSATPVAVTLASPEFKFRRSDNGNPFIYPEVETSTTGIMGIICSGLSTQTNPRKLENGNSLWFTTTGMSTTDCNPGANEMCIMIETGTPDGVNFEITTREWIKFQVDPSLPKLGFFTERRTLSSALCGLNQTSQTQAVLVP